MPDDDKGKFSAEIGQDVIDAALKSVSTHAKPAAEVPLDLESAPTEVVKRPEAPADGEVGQLKAQLEFSMAKGRETLEKLKEEHERMLRATADLENYRKRAQKEKEEIQRYGAEKLLRDFLPVIDNLDRALDHASGDFESLKKGVAMTRKLFEDTLSKHGVKSFSAKGQAFDPRLHEAMQQVETTEVPPNQVVSELVRGYTLNDRLMRPALVAVSKSPEAAQPPATAGAAPASAPTESAPSSGGPPETEQ